MIKDLLNIDEINGSYVVCAVFFLNSYSNDVINIHLPINIIV